MAFIDDEGKPRRFKQCKYGLNLNCRFYDKDMSVTFKTKLIFKLANTFGLIKKHSVCMYLCFSIACVTGKPAYSILYILILT